MTIRKTFTPAHTTKTARGLVLSALMASLAGCGMIGSVVESDKVDYKSSASKKSPSLEVPPDLTQLQKDNRYGVPENATGIATASGYQQKKGAEPVANSGEAVGIINTPALHIERAGSQRWLVVKQTPEQLWPQLKAFWESAGLTIATESAATGIMETDWAENRAKIPQDMIRRTIGKVFDSMYSTGERDKYRTRLERGADGTTEVYISHRGVEEMLSGPQNDTTTWVARANDPELEAQFLSKLMVRLSGDGGDSKTAVAAATGAVASPTTQPAHAKLVTDAPNPSHIDADEGFDRVWRRVGLALDRVGFTVEDRDRTQGLYFVRYVDPDAKVEGFFSRMFTFGDASDKAKEAQRYRVLVKSAAGSSTSQITVLDNAGKPDGTATGEKILNLVSEQIK